MDVPASSPPLALNAPLRDQRFGSLQDGELMIWSEEYSVDAGNIDTEHKDLFDAINDLQVAVVGHEDRESVGLLLIRVDEGTHAYFASEEALMASVRYNGRALHALKHQHLTEQIDAFVARFHRGTDLNDNLLLFIRDWFIPHILEADKNFGHWFREHCLG